MDILAQAVPYRGVAMFTFAMVMAAILESKIYVNLDSKMAAKTMAKVNNATLLL